MREDLGDGYTETLRAAYPDVPESADFVMYWWYKAAEETLASRTRRFGFITTNSIKQTFNRRVVKRALMEGVSLRFAIPDHPWVDTIDGAAVRISMTVGALGNPKTEPWQISEPDPSAFPGELLLLDSEHTTADGSAEVSFKTLHGRIGSGLNIGAELEDVVELRSNTGIANNGVMLGNRGFLISPENQKTGPGSVLRPIVNGNDLLQKSRNASVIDFYGLSIETARDIAPILYEHVLRRVKPERDANRRASRRLNWWLFGEVMPKMRKSVEGLARFIATAETAKHRIFSFLESHVVPEHPLIAIALDDAFHLGVLSSRIHVVYALAAGGTLEDRPRYNKSRCFDPFPFPACTEPQKARIRDLAEALDAHRKRAQADHALGLTDIYNVLEKLRTGEVLTAKNKKIHDNALVSTLKQLHDDLDHAVCDAYGWSDLNAAIEEARGGGFTDFRTGAVAQVMASPEDFTACLSKFQADLDAEILKRVVTLNAQRAAEEARGLVRYLRPEFQSRAAPRTSPPPAQASLELPVEPGPAKPRKGKTRTAAAKLPWPKSLAERTKALDTALAADPRPRTTAEIAKTFTRAKPADVEEILETLVALGRLRRTDDGERWLP